MLGLFLCVCPAFLAFVDLSASYFNHCPPVPVPFYRSLRSIDLLGPLFLHQRASFLGVSSLTLSRCSLLPALCLGRASLAFGWTCLLPQRTSPPLYYYTYRSYDCGFPRHLCVVSTTFDCPSKLLSSRINTPSTLTNARSARSLSPSRFRAQTRWQRTLRFRPPPPYPRLPSRLLVSRTSSLMAPRAMARPTRPTCLLPRGPQWSFHRTPTRSLPQSRLQSPVT